MEKFAKKVENFLRAIMQGWRHNVLLQLYCRNDAIVVEPCCAI